MNLNRQPRQIKEENSKEDDLKEFSPNDYKIKKKIKVSYSNDNELN